MRILLTFPLNAEAAGTISGSAMDVSFWTDLLVRYGLGTAFALVLLLKFLPWMDRINRTLNRLIRMVGNAIVVIRDGEVSEGIYRSTRNILRETPRPRLPPRPPEAETDDDD